MVRNVLVGACALTLGFGSLAVAAPANADCPAGTVATHFNGVCVAAPSGSQQGAPAFVNPSTVGGGAPPGSGFSYVDGIPCNMNHASTCIGLSANP
jgi:hypothetical protein